MANKLTLHDITGDKKKLNHTEDKRTEPIIMLKDVYKDYPSGTHALKGVDLTIDKGEFVFVVGSSGSGKSTFIKTLLKEVEISRGSVYVNGFYVHRIDRKHTPKLRRTMGVVFQNFRLLKDRNVYENIAFAQKAIGVTLAKVKKRVPEVLSMVGLLDKMKANPMELSGGEQQRVAIARALVNKPKLILADEPTGNLDPKNSWEIMKLLEEINRMGTTVLVVTHNKEIVDAMKKRVITLDKGHIVSDEVKGGYTRD